MKRDEFISFLVNQGKTKSASERRATYCGQIERVYGINLDSFVINTEATENLHENIKTNESFNGRAKSNAPNALKLYFEFKTGNYLKTLRDSK